MYDIEIEMQNCEKFLKIREYAWTMVTMFHGEIWNTLEIRYLYD